MESISQTTTTWWSSLDVSFATFMFQFSIGLLISLLIIFLVFLVLAPIIFQKKLTDNPNEPDKFALFANPQPGETNVKMRNGRVIGYIRGGEEPQYGHHFNPWTWYQQYCYQFGLYLIGIPGLQTLYNYELPRIIIDPVIENGIKHDMFTPETDRSNHVRTKPFTFYFVVSGAEIETVPTTVEGSAQVRITPGAEGKALFETDQWNVLLTQTINSVIQGILKSAVTLSDIIGSVPRELWADADKGTDANRNVADAIFGALDKYTIKIGKDWYSLKDVASIEILSIDITNFILEISDEEQRELRSSITGRQKGRGRDLNGQGVANAQKASIDVIKEAGDTGLAVLTADSFVRASEAGSVDALMAGFVKKLMPVTTKGKD